MAPLHTHGLLYTHGPLYTHGSPAHSLPPAHSRFPHTLTIPLHTHGPLYTHYSSAHSQFPCTLTACVLQPHQAVEVVIKVQLETLVCVPEDDQLQEMATQLKACRGTGDPGPAMTESQGEPTALGSPESQK